MSFNKFKNQRTKETSFSPEFPFLCWKTCLYPFIQIHCNSKFHCVQIKPNQFFADPYTHTDFLLSMQMK